MAATDTKRTGLHNQKRGVCVFVSEVLASAAADGIATVSDGSTVCTLPDKSAIISVKLLVQTASASSDTLDVSYNGTVVANELTADATANDFYSGTVLAAGAYSATGGDIVVLDGSQPVDANFRGRLVVEYVELDKVTGEYTA